VLALHNTTHLQWRMQAGELLQRIIDDLWIAAATSAAMARARAGGGDRGRHLRHARGARARAHGAPLLAFQPRAGRHDQAIALQVGARPMPATPVQTHAHTARRSRKCDSHMHCINKMVCSLARAALNVIQARRPKSIK